MHHDTAAKNRLEKTIFSFNINKDYFSIAQ
jgi:hypothetical protein